VPLIVVLVSGRPLDIAAELAGWDALVAAWLPGTEGAGVADVLFGDHAPTGKLPMTWMQSASQQPINDGDGQTALFRYGFGLTWTGPPTPPTSPPPTSPPPTPPPPTSPPPTAPGAACRVGYSTNDWSSGFTGTVSVTNTGTTALNPWSLQWTFTGGQRVIQSWSARVIQAGTAVTATGETWNPSLAAGASVTFGFNGTHTGSNPRPASFTLNGLPCSG
jgi:beta-glucosidase